ncbi:MAG TPA: aminotransferase class III-fold pyridoxal phosphate-dependent enzyme, partial [Chloroflexota bacterium]|nr:aminotransferase class III-fold pyridoxal phosphate-dependent enzyme [Chloroflexota bacterium]
QAYHGPTAATLSLTGRPGLQRPYDPYVTEQPHIPPSTRHFDATGRSALDALDRVIEEQGAGTIAAFFLEPISAAALPAYSPPKAFWEGLAERRECYGFLVIFDEVVTGMGRCGAWFAADTLPMKPDIIATAKGLGAGYVAIGATLCQEYVYEAFASGSRVFNVGHTWDGAPAQAAVALKVIEILRSEGLIQRVHDRGPSLRDQLASALSDIPMVGEVRGHGYLLGVSYVDPRDRDRFLPPEAGVAGKIDKVAMERGLITLSTMPTRDGYAGDQTLFAPPFTTTDDELAEMVDRLAATVRQVAQEVEPLLKSAAGAAVGG